MAVRPPLLPAWSGRETDLGLHHADKSGQRFDAGQQAADVRVGIQRHVAFRRVCGVAVDGHIGDSRTVPGQPFTAFKVLFQAVEGHELPAWAAEFGAESWGQFFLKYIISHPAVTCPIPATTKAHHARDNMGAAYGRLPDEAMRKMMVEFFEGL